MGITNTGTQTKVFDYKQPMTSQGFNALNYKVQNNGIYDGFQVTRVDDTHVNISTGSFVISDDSALVSLKVKTSDTITGFVVSSITTFIVLRLTWVNALNNYVDVLAVKPGSGDSTYIQSGDVVIAKLEYTGSVLSGIDYSYRTFGNLEREKILVDPVSNVLYVNSGTNFWYINSYTIKYINEYIKDNNYVSNKVIVSGASGNYFLIYTGSTYSFQAEATYSISYSTKYNGWYDTNGSRILAYFNFNGTTTIDIIDIFGKENTYISRDGTFTANSDNKSPTEKASKTYTDTAIVNFFVQEVKAYLDSAIKIDYAYTNSLLSTITYYSDLAATEVIGLETLYYTIGVLSGITIQLYYPANTPTQLHTYAITYTNGNITSITDTIS